VQSTEDDQRKTKERRQAAHEAAFTKSLGILAKSVARNEEGDDAKAAVVEAPAKSALPVCHFCCWIGTWNSKESFDLNKFKQIETTQL